MGPKTLFSLLRPPILCIIRYVSSVRFVGARDLEVVPRVGIVRDRAGSVFAEIA